MVTKTKPPVTAPPKKKVDWLPPVAIGLGAVGVAAGLYFFMKKPPGVSPSDTVRAHFTFNYIGDGGSYVLLIRFGWHRVVLGIDWFDPEEGMDKYIKAVTLEGPDTYEFDVDCRIPDGAKASTYDAEGSILAPEMEPGQEWIIRAFKDKALTVLKE